jgi:hypothetical protein
MEFPYDIYISYSLTDNHSSSNSGGWVNNFKKFLDILLKQVLGEAPVFLNYSNQEKPASSELAKVGIFISIISPEYTKNEACIEELNDFVNQAQKNGNLHYNGYERIFKVIKYPVSLTEQPSKILNLLSYDLYDTNSQTGEVSEFSNFFNPDAERKYWLKLVDLAYDIAAVIRSFRNLELKTDFSGSLYNRTVYLAEAGYDLQLHRDNIKRELIRHGFRVLPDKALPLNMREMELAIKSDLEKSRLSIHLIGDSYGELAYNSEKSILDIQNRIAGEHCTMTSAIVGDENKFNRLIWISPQAQLLNDKQKMFVDTLRRDLEAIEGAEILHSPIEDFKMVILEELLGMNVHKIRVDSNKKDISVGKSAYLIYDKVDEFEAKKLAEQLTVANMDVIMPSFDGQLLELREIHLNNLRKCDVGIVFMNQVNDLWVQMKFLDLLKAPGLGRNKGEIHKALIVGKNAKDRIRNFPNLDLPVLELNDNIQNSLLMFLNEA